MVMQTIENKVINRIYGNGRGWVFIKNDFFDLGSSAAIDQALSRMAKQGRIRRVIRGAYDYPRFSKLLDTTLEADIDKVARALARKFGWNIQVSGNTALNILGLSTQVPGSYLYLSDGKTCVYQVGRQELSFRKTKLKDIGLKSTESQLLVQAIIALDKRKLQPNEIRQIKEYFDVQARRKILRDSKYTTSWVYEEIKRIFREEA